VRTARRNQVPDDDPARVASLRAFIVDLSDTTRLPKKTVAIIRTSVSAVLDRLRIPDSRDLDTLDINDTLEQFETIAAHELAANTISTYKNGFRRATALFERWRTADPDWDAPPPPRRSRLIHQPGQDHAGTPVVVHVFPIRADLATRILLPLDLTGHEADRLIQFIRSLVTD
jgi:hypothetical protein